MLINYSLTVADEPAATRAVTFIHLSADAPAPNRRLARTRARARARATRALG